jgi:MYXO-CTERM domain-containing protein
MRARLFLATLLTVASLAGVSFAAPPSTTGTSEKTDLLTQLQKDYDSLSTSDCTTACKALASMERAASRLCEIDPGPTCDDARAKVEDARKRVRTACPMCAATPPKQELAPEPAEPPRAAEVASTPASAPPGGCRSCATGGGDADGRGLALMVMLAASVVVGRRRKP